tara:strand:- start:37 stop:288 length:252 start_codon:yes stop_codon:yes gene_type:complete
MNTKLYVGNLSFETENADLETLFGAHGEVKSANVIRDRDSGRARGFGFVEMGSAVAVDTAIENLNQSEFMGRNIVVNLAKERV